MPWWCAAAVMVAVVGCGSTRVEKAIGAPCSPAEVVDGRSTECKEGLCVALDDASGFCSRTCRFDEGCPEGYACQQAGAYGRVCQRVAGCETAEDCPAGHSCNPATGACFIQAVRSLCSPCQDPLQCPEGGACYAARSSGEQFCTTACGEGDACPLGFECAAIPAGEGGASVKQCVPVSGTCNLDKSLCSPCTGDSECGGPFDLCVRNVVSGETFCGRDCDPAKNVCPSAGCDPTALESASNPDCPTGFSCTNLRRSNDPETPGPFQCVPNSNTCVGFCDATTELSELQQCGIGHECNAVEQTCRAAVDGRQCATCDSDDDCRSGDHPENRCIVNQCDGCAFQGEAFCASPCADDAACVRSFGPGFVCEKVADPSGGERAYCMPQRGTCRSGLGRLGDDCTRNGAQDCLAGVCLVAGRSALCSLPCTADAECGDARFRCCDVGEDGAYDCSPERRTATGPASGSGVCAPLGGLFGDDCTPGRPPCQSGTCLDLGTARVCTSTCDKGCPEGFVCRPAEVSGEGTPIDICFPDGGGKAGADCSFGPAACESGLCIRKASGPVCSQVCTDDAQCPDRWHCEPVQTVDERSVKACLPPSLR